jgi:hypothetical protein
MKPTLHVPAVLQFRQLQREETKSKVTGRSFYRKNNLKFKRRNRNRNRGKQIWDPEPETEPRQNGTVPQHCFQGKGRLPTHVSTETDQA